MMPPTPNNAAYYNGKVAKPPCERTRNFPSGLSHFISVLWSNNLCGLQQHTTGGREQAALTKIPEPSRPPRLSEQPRDNNHRTPLVRDQGTGMGTIFTCCRISVPTKPTECLGYFMDIPVGRGEFCEKHRICTLYESQVQTHGEGLAIGFHQDCRHANRT